MTETTPKVEGRDEISTLIEELKQNPNDQSATCRLGWAQYSLDQIDEAVATFEAARQRWPDDIEVNYALGLALKTRGNAKQALESFKRAEGQKPSTVRGSMMRQLAEEQKEYLLQMK